MSDETDSVPGQLDAITRRIDHGDSMREQFALKLDTMSARLDSGDLRMRFIESGLAENTAVTRGMADGMESALAKLDAASDTLNTIRDVQTGGRLAKKLIAWAGGIAGGVAGMWAAWQAFVKH